MAVEHALARLRRMHVIRFFEEAAAEAWFAGKVRGSVHQSIGQEAVAVGICEGLRRDDWLASNHRGHGHAIAKGADPRAMMLELYGRRGGTCGGKGGSMHIADFSVGMLGANGVVGDGVTLALGAAHAAVIQGQDRIAAAMFGDGAMNRGPLLEALNWSAAIALPILLVCEDNHYSATTRTADVTAGPGPIARAEAFGLYAESVDGNDLDAVIEASTRVAARVRETRGPVFLHCRTYRWRGHFAPDKGAYRDPEEHARLMANDPIARYAAVLAAAGVEAGAIARVEEEARAEIAAHVADAEAAPWPEEREAFTDVQDLGAPDELARWVVA
ncbi:thiamine pyrophosphate-dependent dehydrogenase E1 component subunit alpha [Roseomonas sp. KE2513]|uniref:thiamine pyrophosphate-dependent dehydrogenase E1 component subunit alpha n=1 Tax=Roseomonas sp. KE2513 TaxID=2479202 RepID=UPI001E566FA4|nr:thiamine pyrophosphate-dependent dehydrogenase E1 component subunit alpha [Roseomonas sp. KE2513]